MNFLCELYLSSDRFSFRAIKHIYKTSLKTQTIKPHKRHKKAALQLSLMNFYELFFISRWEINSLPLNRNIS